jgi:tetratricopeptide (TPR) repeat protein
MRTWAVTLVFALAACAGTNPRGPAAGNPPSGPIGASEPPGSDALERGLGALSASRYREAEKCFQTALGDAATRERATAGLAATLLITGRYQEAVATSRKVTAGAVELVEWARSTEAEALRRQGRLDAAELALKSVASRPAAYGPALLLGEILKEKGDLVGARAALMRLIDAYNEDRIRAGDATGLARVGRAAWLLRSPQDANDAFNEAEQASEATVQTLLWRADVFLDAYDPGHAEQVLLEALAKAPRHPEVLAAMAEVRLDQSLDFDQAERLAREALGSNPKLARARSVLAAVALRDMDLESADRELDLGLGDNPSDQRLWSMRAAVRFLADDQAGFAAVEQRLRQLNPHSTLMYRVVGDYADWEHRYDDIVRLMGDALRIDPDDAKAQALLGLNLIRAGREDEGVRALRSAFDRDPFNVRVYNTLELYDKKILPQYTTVEAGRFRIRYRKDQKPILERYVPDLAERAWTSLAARYGYLPETPVGIELYAEPESFAVRTSGLPETYIQGVCFGRTLAVLTPGEQQLNLGMTLWHELAHVFHIQKSDNHVPRWFTEGLAEYETRLARPEWRREHDRELFEALRSGRLPAVADMNRAFTHARNMEDMATAYYAASQILAMLAEQYGAERLSKMMGLWGTGARTAEVIERALGATPAEIDGQFRGWLGTRLEYLSRQFVPVRPRGSLGQSELAALRAAPGAHEQALYALELLGAGRLADAKQAVERARTRDATSADALWAEARIREAEQSWSQAEASLRRLIVLGRDGFAVQMELAKLRIRQKDPTGALAALKAAHTLSPNESEPLRILATMAETRGDEEAAVAALRELASLEPHDSSIYRRLMQLLVARKAYAEACDIGEAAIFADMTGLETHMLFAQALQESGRLDRATFELESATLCEGDPRIQAEAHRRLAKLYLRRGKVRAAQEQLGRARALEVASSESDAAAR